MTIKTYAKIALIITVSSLVTTGLNAAQKLPFIGKRSYNFMGGSGTGQTIEIRKDGTMEIWLHGTSDSEKLYEGSFVTPLQIYSDTQYEITPSKICSQDPMEYRCVDLYNFDDDTKITTPSTEEIELMNMLQKEEIECLDGNAKKCHYIGGLYLHGADGLEPDLIKGVKYLKKGCALKDRSSCDALEEGYKNGVIRESNSRNVSPINHNNIIIKETTYFGKVEAQIIEIFAGDSQSERCTLGYSPSSHLYFFSKFSSQCKTLNNSRGIPIVCTPRKKLCKSRSEIEGYVVENAH